MDTPERDTLHITSLALRNELGSRVLPAMLAAAPGAPPAETRRLLARLAAARMAQARGLLPPADPAAALEALAGLAGLAGPPPHPDALRAGAAALAGLDFAGADPRLPGLLYGEEPGERRAQGRYYTPPALAHQVAAWTLGPLLADCLPGGFRLHVVDPALGCGHFLLAAAGQIAARLGERAPALDLLSGIDRDPAAVELAALTLWLWAADPDLPPGRLHARLLCADALLDDVEDRLPQPIDAVVANPPFASVFTRSRQPGDDRAALRARYASASGSFDLAVPFVERALTLVRPGGRCGLVLPNKLLAADYARDLRAWLSEQATVELIADYSAALPFEAGVYPVAVVLARTRPRPADPLTLHRAGGRTGRLSAARHATQADLSAAPGGAWSAALDPDWPALRACLEGTIPLCDIAALSAGLTVSEAYDLRPFVVDAPLGVLPADALRFLTSGTIRRHRTLWGERPTTFLKRRYRWPIVMVHALPPRRRAQARALKLIAAGLGLRPQVFLDGGLAQASVATVVIHDAVWPLGALSALLNSALAARLYRALFGGLALSGGYLRFGQRELGRFPVPALSAADPRLVQLDALVATMARADRLAAAEIDTQIDALVCELYGADPALLANRRE